MMVKKLLFSALCVGAAAAIGTGGFLASQKNRGTFFRRTYVNNLDIAGKTPEEVAEEILRLRKGIRIQLVENGTVSTAGSPEEFGFTFNEEKLLADLQEAQERQRTDTGAAFRSLMQDTVLDVEEEWSLEESLLYEKVDSRNLKVKRTPSYDAELVFNEESCCYEIQPEIYGNRFKRDDMRQWAKSELSAFLAGTEDGRAACRIEVPDSIYRKPEVTQENAALVRKMNAYNAYAKTKVVYAFGSESKILSFSEIRHWLTYKNGFISLDAEPLASFVAQLAETYDTREVERDFTTTLGETVHFGGGQVEYGYQINQELEIAQLTADIKGKRAVRREPVYHETDRWGDPCYYARNGRDDLAGTYIEVSIPDQYVWFYKNGEVIVETECVTGNHERGMDTTPGVYAITYRQSPAVLRGEGYETPVTFWMPFNGGQGLHDATWRSNFGGRIYRSNGSHGCVNLPYWAAEKIYQNCRAGMPVIVY